MKDRDGKTITTKEFFQRWKKGIKEVDTLTMTRIQLRSHYLIFFGLVVGVIVSSFSFSKLWWLVIILVSSAVLELVQILNLRQQVKMFTEIDKVEDLTLQFLKREIPDKKNIEVK
jgi:hypothetical protein